MTVLTIVPGAPVWVETYGVTLAATVERRIAAGGRVWARVRILADPFGRYAGRATVADGQLRPRILPVAAVGDPIGGCIQVGHAGAHTAAPDCLLIDAAGRCVNPRGVKS